MCISGKIFEYEYEKDSDILDMDTEWDYYSGLPNPNAYVE